MGEYEIMVNLMNHEISIMCKYYWWMNINNWWIWIRGEYELWVIFWVVQASSGGTHTHTHTSISWLGRKGKEEKRPLFGAIFDGGEFCL